MTFEYHYIVVLGGVVKRGMNYLCSRSCKGIFLKSILGEPRCQLHDLAFLTREVKISIAPEINPEWLLTGEGSMLKETAPAKESKNLIPLYDDVATIGRTSIMADTSGIATPTEYIDAGGCILALRQLHEQSSIVWGRNYVVETNEIRVTKRLQTCKDDTECIMAYSTSPETYPDGQLVHEPFKIRKEDIRRVFLVLGRVVKEYSSEPVFTLQR